MDVIQKPRTLIAVPVLVAVGVIFAGCAQPAAGPPPAFSAADSVLHAAVSEGLVPGGVLSVAQHGRVVHERADGSAQLYAYGGAPLGDPPPMTAAHHFDLASLTKVFATTFGIMLLVDQGRVGLDAPVHRYLPRFRGASKDSITVRHLLTHSAGLYPWKPLYYHARTKEETFAYIAGLPLAYPVGRERHYSDLGFMLLGYLIEEVSGRPLDAFLAASFYEPLGLASTAFLPRSRGLDGFAATSHGNPFERRMVADDAFGYLCDEDPEAFQDWRAYVLVGEVNDGNAYHANGGVAGHAGLFSTASDLQVLVGLLLNKGVHGGRRYLTEAVIDTFLTADRFGNGLGWAMSAEVLGTNALPPGAFGHTGFTGTFVVAVPDRSLSIILLTNRQNLGVDASGYYNSVTPLRRGVTARVLEAAAAGQKE